MAPQGRPGKRGGSTLPRYRQQTQTVVAYRLGSNVQVAAAGFVFAGLGGGPSGRLSSLDSLGANRLGYRCSRFCSNSGSGERGGIGTRQTLQGLKEVGAEANLASVYLHDYKLRLLSLRKSKGLVLI